MTTRTDSRYLESDDKNAKLRAFYQGTMDMGGWADESEEDYKEAIMDELRYGLGEDAVIDESDIHIEAIEAE